MKLSPEVQIACRFALSACFSQLHQSYSYNYHIDERSKITFLLLALMYMNGNGNELAVVRKSGLD